MSMRNHFHILITTESWPETDKGCDGVNFKVGMKRKLRLSFLLYCDVYPSKTASEM